MLPSRRFFRFCMLTLLCLWGLGGQALATQGTYGRLAVLEFSGRMLEGDVLGAFSDAVRGGSVEGLVGRGVKVITRENMMVLLREMGKSECSEGDCEVETARNIGADYVVSGSVVRIDDSYVVTLKLHEAKEGGLLATDMVQAKTQLETLNQLRQCGRNLAARNIATLAIRGLSVAAPIPDHEIVKAPSVPVGEAAATPAAAPAPAQVTVAAPAASPAATPDSKMQLGLNLLPMALGKWSDKWSDVWSGTQSASGDLAFAYGVGLSFGYAVVPGLTVGVAPQAVFHVIDKNASGGTAAKEYDLMARVAYAHIVAPKFAIYVEALPGYSISSGDGDSAKGLVLAGGVGAVMDVSDQVFVNLGVGYQLGLQNVSGLDSKVSFLRIAVGAGVRL